MKIISLVLLVLLIPVACAEVDFNQKPTAEEEKQMDEIAKPVIKIINLLKYFASIIGVLVLAFAGLLFITAGGEQAKKEKAKQMATGVVIGLIVFWIAPLVVKYILS